MMYAQEYQVSVNIMWSLWCGLTDLKLRVDPFPAASTLLNPSHSNGQSSLLICTGNEYTIIAVLFKFQQMFCQSLWSLSAIDP